MKAYLSDLLVSCVSHLRTDRILQVPNFPQQSGLNERPIRWGMSPKFILERAAKQRTAFFWVFSLVTLACKYQYWKQNARICRISKQTSAEFIDSAWRNCNPNSIEKSKESRGKGLLGISNSSRGESNLPNRELMRATVYIPCLLWRKKVQYGWIKVYWFSEIKAHGGS